MFPGDRPEAARPPIVYSQPGMRFYGEPKVVRDVDVLALWEPRDRREGKSCGFYKTGAVGPSRVVDHYLQDYLLVVVDRRSGKRLAERLLVAKDGPCPDSFVARPGEAYTTVPADAEVDAVVSPLRK